VVIRSGDGGLYAALYDWHNSVRLRQQTADVPYFREYARLHEASRILVLGCGTGRVAGPLADDEVFVLGVDLDLERLMRAKAQYPRLSVVSADGRRFGVREPFDLIIVPYSTTQLLADGEPLQQFVKTLALCLSGSVLIDVSDNFASHETKDWHLIGQGYSAELGCEVSEWQAVAMTDRHCKVSTRYVLAGRPECDAVDEIWHFHPHDSLVAAATNAGLELIRVDRGYGGGVSAHRRIYHFRREDVRVWGDE
jgi:SAM-dependent methyltransferase